jgi:hypothetical protein
MTNPVIEAVARAICIAEDLVSPNAPTTNINGFVDGFEWQGYVSQARAALQALKDNVSEEMLGDDTDICVGCCNPEPKDKRELFGLMIDTAMKEETDGE